MLRHQVVGLFDELEGLGGVALLEEGQVWRSQKPGVILSGLSASCLQCDM